MSSSVHVHIDAAPKFAASILVVCLQASLRTDPFNSDKRPIILFDGVCNM
jgi:hypothetical protein